VSDRKCQLAFPFGGFFGVSFYSDKKIETEHGYKEEPLNANRFPWKWFVHQGSGQCVRAFLLGDGGVRILGSPIGDGAAAYDVPSGLMLVHDFGRIWAVDSRDFGSEYLEVDVLRQSSPKK